MAIAFRSVAIPGSHEELKIGPWEIQVSRTRYNNVIGSSEQRGERGGRSISWDCVYHNSFASAALLEAALEALEKDCPINGKLAQTGTITRDFERCTFEGIDVLRDALPSAQYGWFKQVRFRFFQLAPDT